MPQILYRMHIIYLRSMKKCAIWNLSFIRARLVIRRHLKEMTKRKFISNKGKAKHTEQVEFT